MALGSHINNIYHTILEIQQQLPHSTQHMNTGDVIQINAPEFDPDIDGGPLMKEHGEIQGSDSSIQHLLRQSKKNKAPALPQQVAEEVDWPDAVPVEIPPQPTQDNDHNITASSTQHETNCKVLLLAIRWRLFLCVLLFLLQLCQRFLLLWLCIKCIATFGECCESVP